MISSMYYVKFIKMLRSLPPKTKLWLCEVPTTDHFNYKKSILF